MKPICIVPARGGSKRLPRKNILPFQGRPLLTHVIDTAQKSQIFSQIIVSSEDDEILDIARNSDAVLHKRHASLATDTSTVIEVCAEVLGGQTADYFCCIYSTAVLLSAQTLQSSHSEFQRFGAEGASVLMGVSEYNFHPIQALQVADDGCVSPLFPKYQAVQSQHYPKVRVSNGSFYWARVASFLEEKTFYSQNLKVFDVPASEVCDIDTQADYDALLKR